MDNQIYSKVFTWLFVGLLVTFGVGYLTLELAISNETFFNLIFSTGGYWFIAIAEIVIAIYLSARIYKMQGSTAKILYLAYCALTGLTFSALFVIFDVVSIIYVFLATAIIFGVFALIGKNTKIDLSKLGIYLFMALLGIIILEVINIFWANSTLDMVVCIVALIVFVGYIAYDMQKIKRLSMANIPEENLAIIGAFNLYLDFINIFIRLLELFGKRRD
jgi:hypothetical protein